MLLPDHKGQIVPTYGGSAFEAEAKDRLPEIDFSGCDGAIHLVMGRLAEAGREAVKADDLAFLGRMFAFVARAVARLDAHREIENAVAISFLEPSDFASPNGAAARKLLPDRLRSLIDAGV